MGKITDKDILDRFFTVDKKIKSNYKSLLDKDEYIDYKSYLDSRYNDIPDDMFSYKEVLFRIKNNVIIRPVCKICGAPVKFEGKTMGGAYPNCYHATCCKQHERLLAKQNEQDTLKSKYGDDVHCTFEIPGVKEKSEAARISDNAKAKRADTMIARYGVSSNIVRKDVRETAMKNSAQYRKEHKDSFFATIKRRAKLTNEMKSILLQNPDKSIDDYRHMPEYEEMAEAYDNTLMIADKIFTTQKTNKTLNSSTPENRLYEILASAYTTLRNYESDEYPYKCDFYLPELKLYVEYQGSMFHNGRPYTDSDKDEVEYIKTRSEAIKKATGKTTTRYDNLIYTWCTLDVLKRNTAERNNLNYLEIYPKFALDKVIAYIKDNYSINTKGLHLITGT